MKIRINFYHLFFIGALAFSSCQKDYVMPKPVVPTPPPDTTVNATVFFATDIYPIFSNGNCKGCHPSQSPPNFSSITNAFTSLTTTLSTTLCGSVAYVNTSSPSTSLLYTKLRPVPPCGNQMGQGYGTVSQADVDKILTWITEGAKNN